MDRSDVTVVVLVTFIAAFFIGAACGMAKAGEAWRIDAIRHNAGHYEAHTAQFVWNNEGEKTDGQ